MDELEQLRSSATLLLTRAQEGSSLPELASAVEKATAVQKLVADLENSRATVRKTKLEEDKLKHENETATARDRSERYRDYVGILAPLLTVITLAATLIAQNYQFVRSEKDKNEASSDTQWQQDVKTLLEATHVPPALVTLQPYLKNPKYADRARLMAVQLAINGDDPEFFGDLMGIAFVPANWNNLDDLLKIDRALNSKASPVYSKAWDSEKQIDDLEKLDDNEKKIYTYVDNATPILAAQIGSVLKSKRPNTVQLDLSGIEFYRASWSGVNLSGTTIENTTFSYVDLKNADLTQITGFRNARFYETAWWEARSISSDLLSYLQSQYPCDPQAKYGYGPKFDKRFTKEQCDAEINRLSKAPVAVIPHS